MRSRVRVWVIPTTLKMVLTAPEPVLVILSVSKGNALAIERYMTTLHSIASLGLFLCFELD